VRWIEGRARIGIPRRRPTMAGTVSRGRSRGISPSRGLRFGRRRSTIGRCALTSACSSRPGWPRRHVSVAARMKCWRGRSAGPQLKRNSLCREVQRRQMHKANLVGRAPRGARVARDRGTQVRLRRCRSTWAPRSGADTGARGLSPRWHPGESLRHNKRMKLTARLAALARAFRPQYRGSSAAKAPGCNLFAIR
jgi:hypothetical protein